MAAVFLLGGLIVLIARFKYLLYKLERATRELAAVGQQVVSLSEEFKQRW